MLQDRHMYSSLNNAVPNYLRATDLDNMFKYMQGQPKPLWGPKQNFIWGPLCAANMTGYCQS